MKKINPVLLLEMEVDSKAGRNGSHPVREQEELELDDSPEKGDYGGSLPLFHWFMDKKYLCIKHGWEH